MKKKLLVIGGNGFIGSNIVNKAFALGWEVTNLSASKATNISIENITSDITRKKTINWLRDRRYTHIVNAAGYVDHSNYFKNGRSIIEQHLIGHMNIIDSICTESLECYLNIGSGDEYGMLDSPLDENDEGIANTPYMYGKQSASKFLKMLFKNEGLPTITLRVFLTYGPGQALNRFIPQIIRGCIHGGDFKVTGCDQVRDFCYISDLVDAVFTVMNTKKLQGEIVNVGSGCPIRIKDVVEEIQRKIGSGNAKYGEIPYRLGENMVLFPSTKKILENTDWYPKISLSLGIEKTIESFMNSPKL
jgi:nucleoside-diphosphate-sugar epimerase